MMFQRGIRGLAILLGTAMCHFGVAAANHGADAASGISETAVGRRTEEGTMPAAPETKAAAGSAVTIPTAGTESERSGPAKGNRLPGKPDIPKSKADETGPGQTAAGQNPRREKTIPAKQPGIAASFLLGDSLSERPRTMHRIGAEFRPEHIFTINPFLQGENLAQLPVDLSLSAHLKYAFGFRPGSHADKIYGGVYQGIGAAYYDFANPRELGNPVAVYLFQGARIARITSRLSLDYEWNFGLSFGWKPYDREQNSRNIMMGSKVNALLNVNFFLRWMLTRELDLTVGPTLTHFSNGNTQLPNAGLNSAGLQAGLTYNFGRKRAEIPERSPAPPFRRHVSYDVVLFGSWCSKGVEVGGDYYASPDTYPVVGLNLSALYNFGYKFRAGISLDGVYDGSANVYVPDHIIGTGMEFVRPSIDRQLALGLSARAEFVMPYFTIGLGLGANMLHKGGDLKAFYQILALKIGITHSSFLHIGYSLRDFHMPNFLMLGVGYRFNNKYPRHY